MARHENQGGIALETEQIVSDASWQLDDRVLQDWVDLEPDELRFQVCRALAGLTARQLEVLMFVAQHPGGVSVQQLRENARYGTQLIASLRALYRAGLLERAETEGDRWWRPNASATALLAHAIAGTTALPPVVPLEVTAPKGVDPGPGPGGDQDTPKPARPRPTMLAPRHHPALLSPVARTLYEAAANTRGRIDFDPFDEGATPGPGSFHPRMRTRLGPRAKSALAELEKARMIGSWSATREGLHLSAKTIVDAGYAVSYGDGDLEAVTTIANPPPWRGRGKGSTCAT